MLSNSKKKMLQYHFFLRWCHIFRTEDLFTMLGLFKVKYCQMADILFTPGSPLPEITSPWLAEKAVDTVSALLLLPK